MNTPKKLSFGLILILLLKLRLIHKRFLSNLLIKKYIRMDRFRRLNYENSCVNDKNTHEYRQELLNELGKSFHYTHINNHFQVDYYWSR